VYVSKNKTIYAASRTGQLVVIKPDGKATEVMLTDIIYPSALEVFNDDVLVVIGERSIVFFNMNTNQQQGALQLGSKISASGRINKHPYIFDEQGRMHEIVSLDKMETKRKPASVKGIITAFARSDNKGINTYGTNDGKIYVEEKNGRVKELVGHRSRVSRIRINENRLFSSSYDGTINLWIANTEKVEPITLFSSNNWILYFNYDRSKNYLWLGDQKGNLSQVLISVPIMVDRIKHKLKRDFTQTEWNYYIGENIPYESFLSKKGKEAKR
jgi:WD40 repeat protein